MSDNIKVVVKVRPLISREIEEKLCYQWRVKNNTLYTIDHSGKDQVQSFTFDKVYDESTKTSDVYNDVAKPIVEAATAGFNGTIFAYGQTSSGKTYTMSGTDDSPGVIQMAVLNLFELIKNIPDRDFLVRVSYIEIYNETVKDLLNIEKENIKINESHNGSIKVDVIERPTSSPEDVFETMKEGEANRQTGATNMNEKSSRSHSIFQIIIESRKHIEGDQEAGCVNVSHLNLVDLAGSERAGQTGATGIRFKEGTHINKSLSVLALVIKQLSEDPNKYANYRDSKLTRILQNSLGGNAKTSIICAVTPAAVEETISTLQFANRAKAIKNKPEVNEVATNATMIQSLTKQLSKLKTQLETKKTIEQDNYNLQKQIANLQKFILNGLGQSRDIEAPSRRKIDYLRRKTISTIHSIEEDLAPDVPQFRTPILKYNPMTIPGVSEFAAVQGRSTLATLPEEPCDRAVTPPRDKQVNFNDEIIEIGATKTPPCILRKNAKAAEKSLKDILHLTEREKIYTPSTVELLEKLDQNSAIILRLQDEVENLNKKGRDKDFEVEQLKAKVKKTQDEMKSVLNIKEGLEIKCNEYDTRLTDYEVSYETLKQKAKRREEELLSLLEEQVDKNKIDGATLTRKLDKEISNFMDISKEISLVDSDSENSVVVPNQSEKTLQLLLADLQTQITCKNNTILEQEEKLQIHKQKIEQFQNTSQELQEMISNLRSKLSFVEEENLLFKSTIENLNSTIKNQKENLESANNDMDSYNKLIQELQIKLTNKEKITGLNLSDSVLQNMLENEEKFIANNENMKNIMQCFKLALDSRDKEIDLLKSNVQNMENKRDIFVQEELNAKTIEMDVLNNRVINLNKQIEEHVLNINKLLEDKKHWESVEIELNQKITSLTKYNKELKTLNEENAICILKLKEEIKILHLNLKDKTTTEENLVNVNKNLSKQVADLSLSVKKLEKDVKEHTEHISLLQNQNLETETHLDVAKSAVSKLKNVLLLLENDIQKVPDSISNFVEMITATDNLEVNLKKYVSDRAELTRNNMELNKYLDDKSKKLLEMQAEFDSKQQSIDKLTHDNQLLSQQLQESNLEIDIKTNKIFSMEKELEEVKEAHKQDLDIDMVIRQDEPCSISLEKIESLEREKEELTEILQSKEDSFTQSLLEKDKNIEYLQKNLQDLNIQLSEKCSELDSVTQHITDIHTRMNQAQNDRDQSMVDILSKVNSITTEFHITNDLSCQFVDANINIYEKIILTIEKIKNHIKLVDLENSNNDNQRENVEKILLEAKEEIRELTEQNLILRETLSKLETNTRLNIAKEVDQIRKENDILNKNLITSEELLACLKNEVAEKAAELDAMKGKAKSWNEDFNQIDLKVKEQMEEMDIDNERLKILCQHGDSEAFLNNDDMLDLDHSIRKNLNKCTGLVAPPSLLTICCNKIFDSIQPKESESNLTISSISSSNLEFDKVVKSKYDQLSMNLDMVQTQCSELALTVQNLEKINKQLLEEKEELQREHEDVRSELISLVEPALELKKKIANHKTNLSILTATTYAENKLLKSHVTALQHHHNRFHKICQKDLASFKRQLQDLLIILKETHDCNNMNLKRYSLPDVLEKNTSLRNFTNESTLDGDILMLDTNITSTTAADNTQVGCDQSCLDLTQTLYNEASCQTSDVNETIDIRMDLELLKTDNQNMIEKIKSLNEQNSKLKDQVNELNNCNKIDDEDVKYNNQLISAKTETNILDLHICSNCQNNKDMLTKYEEVLQERDSLISEISIIKNERVELEQKCNKYSLEILLKDELVNKINALEKDYAKKLQEIMKLTNTAHSKNKQLEELQEENDCLSTQLMESVSELDTLTKKLENYERRNTELLDTCSKLENELETFKTNNDSNKINCPRCTLKDGIPSQSRKSVAETHTKLNRSYSDSETSSRYNKICTLQNELHAGREDCIELTEDVTTIKNHLDRSNLSMNMDVSMGDPNVFTCSKDLSIDLQPKNMPHIPEECHQDIYLTEKSDCFNYFLDICDKKDEYLNQNMKIIDIMKMLYIRLTTKHNNEVENLLNNLKDYEESKCEKQDMITNLMQECAMLKSELCNKESSTKNRNVLTQIRNNLNLLQTELIGADNIDIYSRAVSFFKENVLKSIDCEFETSTLSTFELLITTVLKKHESELSEIISKYNISKDLLNKATSELSSTKESLAQMEIQLTDRVKEYNLLKAQKDKIFEISDALTKDILHKEKEINNYISECCRMFKQHNIIDIVNIDSNDTASENLKLFLEQIVTKIGLRLENDKIASSQEFKSYKDALQAKEAELADLKMKNHDLEINFNSKNKDIIAKNEQLESLIQLHNNLEKLYENTLNENKSNLAVVGKMTQEIEFLRETIKAKDALSILMKDDKITELINQLNEDNQNLKTMNEVIITERDKYKLEMENALEMIERNKEELNKMNSDILILRESVKEHTEVVHVLKNEATSLLTENLEIKSKFDEKCQECSRMQTNIKTHLKTSEIQCKIITRLKKQKEEDDVLFKEKEKEIEELKRNCNNLKADCDSLQSKVDTSNEAVQQMRIIKESLEARLAELALSGEKRRSIEAIGESSRRRRQSLYDSMRIFADDKLVVEENNAETIFNSKSKPDDLFMDVDGDVSNRSTPIRLSKGRDSLLPRTDQSDREEEHPSRPSSVNATRRRRQSTHDLRRSVVSNDSRARNTPSPFDNSNKSLEDVKPVEKINTSNSELSQLKEQLASCLAELEDLREKYREVDEECEICSQYLRERDAQCLRLTREKKELEQQVTALKAEVHPTSAGSQVGATRTVANACVNTDEDWTNLHSLVVDRMSFDAEVEKNKKLTKTIEELRYRKQEMQKDMAKIQRAMNSRAGLSQEDVETLKCELFTCKEELEELKERYKELNEECSQMLKESEEQCKRMRENKDILEAKLRKYEESELKTTPSVRKRRQTIHDQNRNSSFEAKDAFTEIGDDFLSYQVERDHNVRKMADEAHAKETTRLKQTIEKLFEQKAALEQQMVSLKIASAQTTYVATGSAIVQNQQITDVMKENYKLKKINAKLMNIYKKRDKSQSNRENEEPSEA